MPVGVGELQERGPQLHSGVVDEDVQRAHPLLDVRDPGGHRGAVGHVEGDRVDLAGQPRRGLGEPVRIAAVQHDRAAGLRQAPGQREADAPAGPGDQRRTAADVEEGVGHRRTFPAFLTWIRSGSWIRS
ncbi:hypothetical protein GCM10010372_70390 [Streptomyces tauricus]|nr:hypothetical protein GCM10010372_70390 [Streptomyces tauricus]